MNFDRLAPHYEWMETFIAGNRLQRARTCWLEELRGRQRVLSVGEGHGRFSKSFVARFPESEVTVLEASERMLTCAQRHLSPAAHVRWHHGNVLSWNTDLPFDAIVTCFFLDCFPPDLLATVVERLARCSAPDAVWLVVDFSLPARGLARWRARAVHGLMYTFFRLVVDLPARRLTPPDELLRGHGFELAARREFEWGLLRADLWRRTAR
ncbi:MAG: class I SAM-dependent methyltransferase [Opitutaceae bacterium]|nr:class I SAM-dependent methyltransferase [Opitutaceae bacterium]